MYIYVSKTDMIIRFAIAIAAVILFIILMIDNSRKKKELEKFKGGIHPDKERYDKALKDFEYIYSGGAINDDHDRYFHEYLEFSRFMQGCFISKHGYIIDTGNFQTVNLELMTRIKEKIENHPTIWNKFFMVG